MNIQFPQHCLLERLFLSSLYIFGSFVKSYLTMYAWIYFGALYSLLILLYVSIFMIYD